VITLELSGVADGAGNAGVGSVTYANYAIDTRVNQAPAAVTLVDPVISDAEGGAPARVALISVTDDEFGTEVLSLVGADDALFEIRNGTELWFKGYADYETRTSYAVQVKATDEAGLSATSSTFTLRIGDLPDTPTPRNDVLATGSGDNVLRALAGNDQVAGGLGDDNLRGLRGNDKLLGEDGADVLRGGRGHDRLDGDAGNDVLKGGPDADLLIGGEGTDRFVFRTGGIAWPMGWIGSWASASLRETGST
jgi:Ca2+-binding RTX toxin-like protein